jgi:hypothetical protein
MLNGTHQTGKNGQKIEFSLTHKSENAKVVGEPYM